MALPRTLLDAVVYHDRDTEDDLVDARTCDRAIDVQRRGRVVLGRRRDGSPLRDRRHSLDGRQLVQCQQLPGTHTPGRARVRERMGARCEGER